MAKEDFPRHLRGAWAKMPAQLATVALILHCVRAASGEPLADEIDTIALHMAAVQIEDYFKPHARRVYQLVLRVRATIGPRILRYIMDCGGRAKQSDIFRYALGGNVEAREMLREMERYEADDVLGREPAGGGTPGRPATWWFLRSYVSTLGVPGNGTAMALPIKPP